jgi:hypothetical protein
MDVTGLPALVARQRGLFTRRQALELGYSRYQIRRRLAGGQWQAVLGDVLAEAGRPITGLLREQAALLAVPGGVLAGPSAARRHGLRCTDHRIFVAVGVARRVRHTGIVYLAGALPAADVVRSGGCPVTAVERTVFDCCLLLADDEAAQLLRDALDAGLVTVAGLASRVHAHAGRRGAPRLARLMRAAAGPIF